MMSITPIVTETGNVTLAVGGLGITSNSGTIQLAKPAGAEVRSAFMAAASRGFSSYQIQNGDISIDGQPVSWGETTASSINSYNTWADVTA